MVLLKFLMLFALNQKKNISFDIHKQNLYSIPGNTMVSASAMEGESFMKLINEHKDDRRITGLVKDGDIEIQKIIDDSNWGITAIPNTNHLRLSLYQKISIWAILLIFDFMHRYFNIMVRTNG